MLSRCRMKFKLGSTHFQQAFNIVGRPVQTHRTFRSTTCRMHVEENVVTNVVTV